MNKPEFIKGFADYSGYSQAHCKEIYSLLERYIRKQLLAGVDVKFHNVCTLTSKIRPPFETNDLNNGGRTVYPAKRIPHCIFSDTLKEAIGELRLDEVEDSSC